MTQYFEYDQTQKQTTKITPPTTIDQNGYSCKLAPISPQGSIACDKHLVFLVFASEITIKIK